MSEELDFRKLPLKQDDASELDRAKIRDLLEYERYCRDYGLYDEAAACYDENAQIHVSWFNGPAKEYWERTSKAKGAGSKHRIFSTAIFMNEDRTKAVGEMSVLMQSPRITIDDCPVDLASYARIFSRLVKEEDGSWKIMYGDCIYGRDELIPVAPTKLIKLPDSVKDYRESYRNLSYVLSLQGLPSGQDLPGDDKPETIEKLYDETNKWMFKD